MRGLVRSVVALGALLLVGSTASYASTVNVGTLSGTYDTGTVAFSTVTSPIDYTFNVTSPFNIEVDLSFAGTTLGKTKSIELFSGTPGSGTPVPGDIASSLAKKGTLSFVDGILAAGSYFVQVVGPARGGNYDLTIDVTATPLPSTISLFIGGMALLGGFAVWRRKRQDGAGSALTFA